MYLHGGHSANGWDPVCGWNCNGRNRVHHCCSRCSTTEDRESWQATENLLQLKNDESIILQQYCDCHTWLLCTVCFHISINSVWQCSNNILGWNLQLATPQCKHTQLKCQQILNNQYFNYCKTLYFRCILISRFWNVEITLHFNLALSQCSTIVYVRPLMGKLNFCGYLISRLFPTREIRENLMHAKK